MNKITKILIFIAIVMTAVSINAQQNCNVVCHNGTLLSGVNENALSGHLKHGDTFITNDCDYVETGTECESLSIPKFNINKPIPQNVIGTSYILYDINGRLIRVGNVESNLKSTMPRKGVYLLQIEGYQTLKLLLK